MAGLILLGLDTSIRSGVDGGAVSIWLNATYDTTIAFDWNFSAFDQAPNNDFVFLVALDVSGQIAYFEKLAAISPALVPEPSTLLLLGAGIASVAAFRKFRR